MDTNAKSDLIKAQCVICGLTTTEVESIKEIDTRLMKFYDVSTASELIEAQAKHIERLQSMLQYPKNFAQSRVREG